MGSAVGERVIPIVGRWRELERLGQAMTGVPGHRPSAWFVHGESGVGKTRLLTETCARAEALGCTVLWGRCVHFGAASAPYAPLVSPIEDWLSTADEQTREEFLAELDAVSGNSGSSHAGRILRVVERLLGRIESRTPLVLVIDDLQWADSTSLDLLAYLVAGFGRQRMAVLVAFRDTELVDGHPLHGWLADLRRLPFVHDLPLSRLDEAGTDAVVEAILGRVPSPRLVREVHGRAAGNPYLTELLVRDLPAHAESLPPGLPGELREVLLAGWHRLRTEAREVLRLVAVGGRPLPHGTFAEVAERLGHDPASVAAALADGTRTGLLHVERGDAYWFRHPLLAEVLTATLLPGEEIRLHRAFVEVLSRITPRDDADEMRLLADLALHHEGAAHQAEAFTFRVRAADHAARLQGYPEQARHLLRAVELLPEVDREVVTRSVGDELTLLERAAFACSRSGELQAAHELVTRGLARVNREQDALLATRLLTEWCDLVWTNQMVEQHPLGSLIEAVELSRADVDSPEHAVALARLAKAECASGMLPAAAEHAAQAVSAAKRSESDAARALALSARAIVHLREPSSLHTSQEAYVWARRSGDPVVVAEACSARVQCLEEQGRVREVLEAETAGFAVVASTGARAHQAYFAGRAALDSLRIGAFADARRWIREGLAARSLGRGAVQVRRAAAVLAIREGHLPEAAEHIERIRELSPAFVGSMGSSGPLLCAEYQLAQGKPAEALVAVEEILVGVAVDAPRDADMLLVWGARAAGEVARQARDAGDVESVRMAAARLRMLREARETVAPAPFVPSGPADRVAPALGLIFEAEAARSDGSAGRVERWRSAAGASERSGLRWESAVARRWLAEALLEGQGSNRPETVEAVFRALVFARELGARPLCEDLENLARAARIDLETETLPVPASPVVNDSVLRALTPRETEILTHLVTGRSYTEIAERLFISDKTVSVHVSNILRKTGARNRNEVSALARRHGIRPGRESGGP